MIEALEAAIGYEVADKAIPSISYALFDASEVIAESHVTAPGTPSLVAGALLRIGSISKTFAAVAALREAAAGRLDLDQDVSRYIGPFDPSWQGARATVTLRGLLSHRSGLTREAARGHYLADDNAPLATTIDSLRRTRLKVAPDGRTFRYSNAGYALVGAAIEAASGRSYADYLAQHVFEPLGLAGASLGLTEAQRDRLAPAKMWSLDGDRPAPVFNLGCAPAGNIAATIGDLARYGQALLGDALLPRETLETMWKPADGGTSGYGLGFMAGELDGVRTIGHGGVAYGYASQLILLPGMGLGIVMVATMDVSNDVVMRLCRYGLRLALAARGVAPAPLPPRRLARCDPERAHRLAGHFAAEDGSRVETRASGGTLLLVDRLMPLELRPIDAQRFVPDGLLRGEDSSSPQQAIEWVGVDAFAWNEQTWRRTEDVEPVPASVAGQLGDYAPAFLPSRLIASDGKLVCVMEEFFPQACTPLGTDHYALGPGMYEDEILELSIISEAGRPAIRLGEMVLERAA